MFIYILPNKDNKYLASGSKILQDNLGLCPLTLENTRDFRAGVVFISGRGNSLITWKGLAVIFRSSIQRTEDIHTYFCEAKI
jgi:hypothetical protein